MRTIYTRKEIAQLSKNPWIKVREDRVISPDGKDGVIGVVEMMPGVSVLRLNEEGFVYLTNVFQYAIKKKV